MKFFEAMIQTRSKHLAGRLLVAMIAMGSVNAWADEAAEVSRLIKGGQLDQAMARADVFLSTKPRDAQMRFLKGLIYTEKNRPADAINVFTKLTEDYPELPEPYNNLAVLYASQGQFDKARSALEMAIRTHPSYATAHENLGDVYAKLASQSYDKALQLDSNNSTAQTKLALIRDLIGNRTPKTAAAPPPTSTPLNIAARATAPAPAATAPAFTPAPVVTAAPVFAAPAPKTPLASAPISNAPPSKSPADISKSKEVAPKEAVRPSDADITRLLSDWARAWSDQDVDTYLSYYSRDFETPPGQNRKRWEFERRKRIEGKNRIDVKVENVSVSFEDNRAIAKFKQTYTSDKLSNIAMKTMVLAKTGNKWQILEERAAP